MDLLIIAALKEEVADLIKATDAKPSSLEQLLLWRYNTISGGIFICGVGKDAVRKALPGILEQLQPKKIWIAGWSGALSESLKELDLVVANQVSSHSALQTSFQLSAPEKNNLETKLKRQSISYSSGSLVTTDEMITQKSIKNELSDKHKASIVDMETFYIMEFISPLQIPTGVIRIITDMADESIGIDFDLLPKSKSKRLAFFAQNPKMLLKYHHLTSVLKKASKQLDDIVLKLISADD
jgi:nucleoside phosphorylase